MSGYPQGNPQYPPPQAQIYPQLYNPSNAPPPGALAYPAPGQAYPYQQPNQPGFQGYTGYHGQQPTAMSYPTNPTAPPTPYGNYVPTVTPQQPAFGGVEWIPTTPRDAMSLSDRAVVAGYEAHDNSPLWVIRARHEGDLIPGKLAAKHYAAYVPWGGKENAVNNIEVCCARPNTIRWVETTNGIIPPQAIPAGNTASGETLYVGRAKHQGSLTPGKVHPSHQVMYISFAGNEIPHHVYEVLCQI